MNEVKRQAMSEVQKAVAEAEQKAFEMIASERARMEQTIADAKRQATEDAFLVINEQEESTEVSCQGTAWEGLSRAAESPGQACRSPIPFHRVIDHTVSLIGRDLKDHHTPTSSTRPGCSKLHPVFNLFLFEVSLQSITKAMDQYHQKSFLSFAGRESG